MKIIIGADHKGFELKERIKEWFLGSETNIEDLGAFEKDPDDDYPIIAEKVARKVAGENGSRGILICGSGVGVDIVANKIEGIRCGLGMNEKQVEAGRNDDDINILAIASDFTDFDKAKKLIQVFLNTPFNEAAKRLRRIEEINDIEEN